MAHNNKSNGNRYPGGTASGHPKRHFLTTGWSDFVNAKKLVPGDAIRGKNGELCVGVRRRMNHTPSVTSSRQNAILATASNAITSGTRFLVTYTPRASQSPFIISLNKYLEAQSHRFSVGMKFEMKFEGEEVLEQRFSGTIVGVGETASSKWPDSEWRSLKGGKWRALCWGKEAYDSNSIK